MQGYRDSIDWLQGELTRRQDKNPAYSLRSFSRLVGTSPGRLSEYLARKRPLSAKVAQRFLDQLVADPVQHAQLRDQFAGRQGATFAVIDTQQIATEWHHFAILSLMETKDFQPSPKFIAQRLGLPVTKIRQAIEDLQGAGMIRVDPSGMHLLAANSATISEVPSATIRESHKNAMRRTIEQLDDIPMALRDISSMTMAIDSRRIPQAKAAIKEFRRSLAKLLEAGERDEVYELNIQFTPLTGRKPK